MKIKNELYIIKDFLMNKHFNLNIYTNAFSFLKLKKCKNIFNTNVYNINKNV